MSNVFLFDWDNYDDNPLDAIGVNTIPTQKEATYAPSAEGELVTDAFGTFMSNADEYAYPQVAEVAGEEPKVLVFGEGFISPEPQPEPPFANGCMYLEAAQANSTVSMVSTLETAPNLEYSTDGVTWQEWQHTTADGTHTFDTITLGAVGDRVYFRGDNPDGLAFLQEGAEMPNFSNFVMTGAVKGGGNVMSLLDKTMALTEVPQFGFVGLFAILGEGLESALLTPPSMDTITTIGDNGCNSMYVNCSSITSAADMPALTTIGDRGCESMYGGCTSLTSAAPMPLLTTIGGNGCAEMYSGCESLTAAADMPSLTTIGDRGCESMYGGCTSLTAAADMPSLTNIGDFGCGAMYGGCTSLTAAADMPSLTNIGDFGCTRMYNGCTFNMSDDGTTLNFAFPTPPVTDGVNTYATAYDIAAWMGNTNGF